MQDSCEYAGYSDTHLKHIYTDYVAWRGTVFESDVSDEIRKIFTNKTTIYVAKGGYIAL